MAEQKQKNERKILAVIRIRGQVGINPDIRNAFKRLRLKRKYTCVLVNPQNESSTGILTQLRNQVAYGEVDKKMLIELLNKRAKRWDKKAIDAEKIALEIFEGKNLEQLGVIPFFGLHPPRKGIDSKLQYPKGVLGDNKKDINKLIERML